MMLRSNYRLVQAIFWFPRYLEDQQKRLYEAIEKHEKEICSKANVGSSLSTNPTEQTAVKDATATEPLSTDGGTHTKPEEKKTN